MAGMTAEQAFAARELHRDGIWSGRIAELLDAEERDVLRVLNGEELEAYEPPPDSPPAAAPAPPPVDPKAWPPPVDEQTEWDTVRTTGSFGAAPTEVQVRWVMLWGKRVRINTEAEVWCHYCLRFHTTKKLSHPFNGCPVGLPHRGGIVEVDAEEMAEDDAHTAVQHRRAPVDFMRVPW